MTPARPWHLDPGLAASYAAGGTDPVLSASVEAHLVACAECRALLPVDRPRLDAVWTEVVAQVHAPRRSLLERLLGHVGLDEGAARLVVTTPSLRGAWLTGVLVVLVLALLTAHGDDHGIALFLALAPILPVAGVALVFGPKADPAHEIVAATPYSLVKLIAARSVLVLLTTMLPAAALTPFLPGGLLALGWLLPGLALTAGTLALSRHLPPPVAAVGLGTLWAVLTLPGLAADRDPFLATHPVVQLLAVLGLLAATAALVHHRHDLPEMIRRTA